MPSLPVLRAEHRMVVPEVRVNTDLDVLTLADHLAKSGFFADCKQASQAVVKILAGAEMGVTPIASMREIHIVQGKPVLSATLMGALIQNSGRFSYRVLECSDTGCVIEFREGISVLGLSRFTLEDAIRAKLADKPIWQQYPQDMCFARAMSRGARRFCAGLFGGAVYAPGEIPTDAVEPAAHVDSAACEIVAPPPIPTPYADAVLKPTAAAEERFAPPEAPEPEPVNPFIGKRPAAQSEKGERAIDMAAALWEEGVARGLPMPRLNGDCAPEEFRAWRDEVRSMVEAARKAELEATAEDAGEAVP